MPVECPVIFHVKNRCQALVIAPRVNGQRASTQCAALAGSYLGRMCCLFSTSKITHWDVSLRRWHRALKQELLLQWGQSFHSHTHTCFHCTITCCTPWHAQPSVCSWQEFPREASITTLLTAVSHQMPPPCWGSALRWKARGREGSQCNRSF